MGFSKIIENRIAATKTHKYFKTGEIPNLISARSRNSEAFVTTFVKFKKIK